MLPTVPEVVLASKSTPVHVEALDGLRGVAAISVMLYHAWVGNSHGWMAVDFFFCLSGFVLALAYERKLSAGLSVSRFMSWRVIRIYPMLFIGGVFGLILWRSGEGAAYLATASASNFLLAYIAHLLLFPYFGGHKAYPFNNVQWSIFYELLVNIVYALLIPVLKFRILFAIVIASGLLLALRAFQIGTVNLGFELDHLDVALARTIFSFFLGVLLYQLRDTLTQHLPRVSFWWLAAVLLVLASLHSLNHPFASMEPLRQIITIELINPAIILLALICITRGPLVRWLGVLSFPLYAIHAPLVLYAQAVFEPMFAGVMLKAAMLSACAPIVGLSLLLGYFIDLPLNRLRRRVFK